MDAHIYPNEPRHLQEAETLGPWKVHPVVEALKPLARAGLVVAALLAGAAAAGGEGLLAGLGRALVLEVLLRQAMHQSAASREPGARPL